MNFDSYFRLFSYSMIAVATLALLLAGGLAPALAVGFWLGMILAWKIEGTKWQLSERAVLAIVVLSIPLFFIDWKYQQSASEVTGRLGVTALAHLIVFLSAVKLLQDKRDRDWIFLYLISFFEVLLAAGLSLSPLFLATLSLYLLCSLSAILAFEIHKAKAKIRTAETRLLVPPDSRVFRRPRARKNTEARRLPLVAFTLLVLIFTLAVPLFLVAPRSGAAALGRLGGGLNNFIGFSENVTLGEIADLKKDNALVMHVRFDDVQPPGRFRWRGVALDEFTGHGWRKSDEARRTTEKKNERGIFQVGTAEARHYLATQTVFLEAIESPVLFAASRPVALQGDFPFVRVDSEGSIQTRHHDLDRIIYKALSDVSEPDESVLKADREPYSMAQARYLDLPDSLNPQIGALANAVVVNAHARNRYDEAKAIETYLQNEFGYSLQMRATGPDPLSDFLFNVKSGHCEYFSTAMAVMLRTRGIASRIVNGFLPGEYNDAAGAYTVRQSDAHSWVEVYFPESQQWVTFDPTPAAGRTEPVASGFSARLGKYAEAFELVWFEYVVGYDRQEQRSLASSLRNELFSSRRWLGQTLSAIRAFVVANLAKLIAAALLIVLVGLSIFIGSRIARFGWRSGFSFRKSKDRPETSAIRFYQRLLALLERRGFMRDVDLTPLEFAGAVNLEPALIVTRAYNRVRFGGQQLTAKEAREVESALAELENETDS